MRAREAIERDKKPYGIWAPSQQTMDAYPKATLRVSEGDIVGVTGTRAEEYKHESGPDGLVNVLLSTFGKL